MPAEVQPLAPATAYTWLGHVIGWTATFGMPQASVDKNLTDFARILTASGWTVSLDLTRNTIYAVRHQSNTWQVISANTDCPAEAHGACLLVVLYVHRPG